MAEEDSFVILGSSPQPSLCSHGNSLLNDALHYDGIDEAVAPRANTSAPVSLEQANEITHLTLNESNIPATISSEPNPLAASFLMGDVKADVLKNSVYSQFPSLCSMQACAEDVVKLQTMMTDYMTLKQTLDKVNHTMQEYYKITQQWREEAAKREEDSKRKLQECQVQIDKLTEENRQLKNELDTHLEQMRLVEDIRQKEHDELRQSVSEKSSLINNMRVEIDKLQQHQINCLKVNLTSTEELLNVTRAEVNSLKARSVQSDEEIAYLKTQIDTYRRDFEMERADREKNAGEKEQYLVDLRALQRRNQELIEALAESHKNRSNITPSTSTSTSSIRDEQRPVRVLDPTGAAAKTADTVFRCPICSKSFNALTVLQSHVNDCLDKM
ncbi:hypothetical protein KR093_005842 [Drosophila rubida]|uniref:NF-kappa-B essential modulator n=1 Tax=Drosophila rubida TaxID=30044 RepID=A0AAD4JZU0_9MUSC|nr:hypothetical protein KR093_005842 [Drosophila rubida]